jgi:hypothetical protein
MWLHNVWTVHIYFHLSRSIIGIEIEQFSSIVQYQKFSFLLFPSRSWMKWLCSCQDRAIWFYSLKCHFCLCTLGYFFFTILSLLSWFKIFKPELWMFYDMRVGCKCKSRKNNVLIAGKVYYCNNSQNWRGISHEREMNEINTVMT